MKAALLLSNQHYGRRDNIYTEFSIVDVARECGIHMKDPTRREIRCRCPFCGNGRGELAASINSDKGLFYCFRCDEGYNAVTLYAKIYGIDTKEAYNELLKIAA